MEKISLEELDKIERLIATQRKRQSLRFSERFPEPEKVILCLYEPIKSGTYRIGNDIRFFVLTNFRIVYSIYGTNKTMEIMLKTCHHAKLTKDIWGTFDLDVFSPESRFVMSFAKKEKEIAEYLTSELNQAISRSKIPISTATLNINSSSVVPRNSQLADELRKLSELHSLGILTDEEFSRAKQKLIG